ncbi:MAG: alanine--tRNA ligase-related protein [Candidatus Zixiibacteriota bacterium]
MKYMDFLAQKRKEIKEKQNHIENVIKAEEESFNRTLETGLSLFETIAKKCKAK